MKKSVLILAFALIFSVTFAGTLDAQVVRGSKKVVKKTTKGTKKTYRVGKRVTKKSYRKTNRGLHKGWYIGKRTGQKSYRGTKRVGGKKPGGERKKRPEKPSKKLPEIFFKSFSS